MSTIECQKCKNKISDAVSYCPHCGSRIERKYIWGGADEKITPQEPYVAKKWYDYKLVVHLWLLCFFPVGLYALWNSRSIAKWWKITATCIIAFIFLSVISGDDNNVGEEIATADASDISESKTEVNIDPLNITSDSVQMLIGAKVPFNKWKHWGDPTTQDGTDNQIWIVYLPKANISFISKKDTDEIVYANFGEDSALKYYSEVKEKRNQSIESQFTWRGSHRNLEKAIKKAMNDPDSYEHVETNYWDMNDHLVIRTTYRGKNAFGGKVLGSLKAKVTLDGEIIEVLEVNQ